jgi:hypothetical protein
MELALLARGLTADYADVFFLGNTAKLAIVTLSGLVP